MPTLNRRGFLVGAAAFSTYVVTDRSWGQATQGPFTLPPLPYAANSLEPNIDAQTMELHHDRHHAAYVNNLNDAVRDQGELAKQPIEQILANLNSVPESIRTKVRNNGGGHANHTMFWEVMAPAGNGGNPSPELQAAIDRDLGGMERLQQDFNTAGAGVFGSGWVMVTADKDGRLTAIEGTYHVDAGGLPGMSPSLIMQASAALYQCPNLKLEGYDVVTNKPRTEAYRAPGGIQAAFCVEQAMDVLCQRLDMDPLEFRKRNAAVTGSMMPIGTPFPSIGLTAILDAVGRHPCWTEPLVPGRHPRGRGLALGYWRGTSMTSAAHVTIAGDGRPMVTMGPVDISGTRTAMAQVVAEEFGLPLEDVHVSTGDTKSVGYSDIAAGSRVARTTTAALVEACADALRQLRARAAEKLQSRPEDLAYESGVFRARKPGGAAISLAELMQATLSEGAILGRGVSTRLPLGVEIGAHVCDVEVDPGTGQVTVLRYTAFQDVGRALNPPAVEGQLQGSVAQGLGWALTEGFDYGPDGRLRNASLLDYRIPTALDVPPIGCVIIETPVPGVPYGVRGVGEVPIVPVAGAVANAIARAIGVRVWQMPMTPERILRALDRLGPSH